MINFIASGLRLLDTWLVRKLKLILVFSRLFLHSRLYGFADRLVAIMSTAEVKQLPAATVIPMEEIARPHHGDSTEVITIVYF